VLTPNGDGVHDQVEFNFNLLQLVAPAPVSLEIYDLSGRRVHTVFAEERGLGPATHTWDGRGPGGKLVPPGHYIWVLRINADAFEERHQGVLSVAY
jgi:flagellar hook assembly protein FlgD